MGWWSKQSRRNNPDNETIVVAVELKIGMHCEKCAKKIRKVVFKLDGVQDCVTDMYNQKVMVGGEFNMEKLLKILKKKTGKKAEIVMKTEKYDEIHTEPEIVPENNEDSETVQKEEENLDKPEPRFMEVEYNIPFPDKYQVDIAKVISKFKGVERFVPNRENTKVVVTGNFDQDKLLRKLNKKLHKKIKDEEDRRKAIEAEVARRNDEEARMLAEMDKAMGINSNPDSDEEREMMAKYMMFSDANPNNACSIS